MSEHRENQFHNEGQDDNLSDSDVSDDIKEQYLECSSYGNVQ